MQERYNLKRKDGQIKIYQVCNSGLLNKMVAQTMINLEILTEDKNLMAACQLYWEVDNEFEFTHKVSKIAEIAKIDKKKLPSIIREACNAYIRLWQCRGCKKPYLLSTRSDLTNNKKFLFPAIVEGVSYECSDCLGKRKEKQALEEKNKLEEKRKRIREVYDLSKRELVDINSLSLTDAVYLLTILREGAYEDLSKIIPINLLEKLPAPTAEFTSEIIDNLYDKNLIHVHPDTGPEAFPEDDVKTFYISQVYYAPPISRTSRDNPSEIFSELTAYLNKPWTEDWCEEALNLWQRVALEESKEYLLFVLNEHHFEFSPGEKTNQYLELSLKNFSTAQVFNTIWRAAKDGAAYYQRGGISKKQAANSVISSIQRTSERAIAENWEIKPFGRNYKCPQTMISEVLYNNALKLGEEGFTTIPNLETIRNKKLGK